MSGGISLSWHTDILSLTVKYSLHTNGMPKHCGSIPCLSVCLVFFPPPFTAVLSLNVKRRVECKLQADGCRARGCRLVCRLCAGVYCCYHRNKKKGQLDCLVCVYTFPVFKREATKPQSAALKLRVCVFGWRSESDRSRSRRSNIVCDPLFLVGSFWAILKQRRSS